MTVSSFRFPCDLSKEIADLLLKVSHTHLAHKTTAGTSYASVETTRRRYIASSKAVTNTSSESQDFKKCSWTTNIGPPSITALNLMRIS